MDRVFIRNLSARGIIGVRDWERRIPQEIRVSIVLFTDTRRTARADSPTASPDYRALVTQVRTHLETAGRHTIEALAADIADLCLVDKRIKQVEVTVEKPGAARHSETVGVTILREQPPVPAPTTPTPPTATPATSTATATAAAPLPRVPPSTR